MPEALRARPTATGASGRPPERDGAAPQPKADNRQHCIGRHHKFSAGSRHRGATDLRDGPGRMRRSAESLRMRVPGLPAVPDPRVLDDPISRRGSGHDIDEMIARPVPPVRGPGAISAQLGRPPVDRNGRTRWKRRDFDPRWTSLGKRSRADAQAFRKPDLRADTRIQDRQTCRKPGRRCMGGPVAREHHPAIRNPVPMIVRHQHRRPARLRCCVDRSGVFGPADDRAWRKQARGPSRDKSRFVGHLAEDVNPPAAAELLIALFAIEPDLFREQVRRPLDVDVVVPILAVGADLCAFAERNRDAVRIAGRTG